MWAYFDGLMQKNIIPLLMHWSYISFALSHRFDIVKLAIIMLKHYHFFAGKNAPYRGHVSSFEEWEKTRGYNLPSDSSETESGEDKDEEDEKGKDLPE